VLPANPLNLRWLFGPAPNNPRAFLRRGRRLSTERLVVCAGDSITHGVASADYVALLRDRFGGRGYVFVNAGISGDLAYNLLGRVDDIVACRPDVVTVQIGSNDVLGSSYEFMEAYFTRFKHIPQSPSLAWFGQNFYKIVKRLQNETEAQIAVLSMPMLGEDLTGEMNQRIARYNRLIQETAAVLGADYLPLNERLAALIEEPDNKPVQPFDTDMRETRNRMFWALVGHYILQRSWDQVAAANGFLLLSDGVHLNDRSAGVAAELIANWLEKIPHPPIEKQGSGVAYEG
jgi:acyl-CoA thioesterase-1